MSRFASRLLAWYRQNGRALPWRGHPDPYAVWISEIMLQQTRVETVIPYFKRWMARFPAIQDAADAAEQDILKLWEGLGYYSRARNLHWAAQIVMKQYGGQLPHDLDALRKLPGIGRYTAGAIASMAFGLDQPTLDGNLRRVLARVFNVSQPARSPAGEKILWELVAEHLPKGRAADYNQALMDLGATICLARKPRCPECPVRDLCNARRLGIQEMRPVQLPKKRIPHYVEWAAVILRRGRVLLAKRPSKGLLGGMWEFPKRRISSSPARGLARALHAAYGFRVQRKAALTIIQHAYTHFNVTVHAFRCEVASTLRNENLKWVRVAELQDYPMGKIDRLIARTLA